MLQVPIEIFEAMIDQADASALHHLSLTCRAFLPRSRYHLFKSILIQTVQQMESSREFFDSCPWILPLVREVALSTLVPPSPATPNVRVLDVAPLHFLSRFPNLRMWKMRVVESTTPEPLAMRYSGKAWLSLNRFALFCYQKYSRQIQNLELSDIPFDDISDFTGLVSAVVGIRNLTCSHIRFRTEKEHETPLHGMSTNPIPTSLLKIGNLRIGASVDIRATEYLLTSSAATLHNLSLAMGPNGPRQRAGGLSNFGRLRKLLDRHQLNLSSLSVVISCRRLLLEEHSGAAALGDWNPLMYMRHATKVLELTRRPHLQNVQVEFELHSIASLGTCLSWGNWLEDCKSLEKTLLTFPFHHILCHNPNFMRARRAEFWSPTIRRAFPKLAERKLLTIPHTNAGASYPSGHEDLVTCVTVSHDSRVIVTASVDGTIIIWDAPSGTVVQEWLAHRHSVHDIALSPDGHRLVSSGGLRSDPILVAWDIGHGIPKAAPIEGHTEHSESTTCAWSPDGEFIASASGDGTVRIWDAQTFQQCDLLKNPQAVCNPGELQFSPDGRYLAWLSSSWADSDSYSCSIWRYLAGQPSKMLPSHSSREDVCISAFSFDSGSRRIATAHGSYGGPMDDHVIRMWDVETGAPLAVFAGHTKPVVDVTFSPNGRSILSASSDGSSKIWDVETGEEMSTFVGDGEEALKACFSPNGEYIAIAMSGGVVRLWRRSDHSCTAVFTEHRCNVMRLAFSPDGEYLTSGDHNGIVHIRRLSNFV